MLYSLLDFLRAQPGETFASLRLADVEALLNSGVLVVDAGSVSHPVEAGRGRRTHDFGTYAVVDLARRTATLRRIDKRAR